MRSFLFMLLCVLSFSFAANAQVYNEADGASGDTLLFQGYGNDNLDNVVLIPGLTASLEYLLDSTDGGLTWVFDITITNTSSIASNLTAFGFYFDPVDKVSSVSLSGTTVFNGTYFGDDPQNGFPNVLGDTIDLKNLDICADSDGGSCKGGGGGLAMGESDTLTLTIALSMPVAQITLDTFAVRFQGFSYEGITSGVGVVPEPATWLMMIIGFSLVAASARRSRRSEKRISQHC